MRRLLLIATLLLGACATQAPRPAPSDQPARPSGALPSPEAKVPSSASYLARAASYDQLVIRAAQVSMSGGSTTSGALARSLAEEHRGLAGQLSFAGRRLNLLPSPALLANHQAWLDAYAAAPTADNYLRLMRQVHQNSYAMHAAFAERGDSPTLRLVARNAAEVERRHYASLR